MLGAAAIAGLVYWLTSRKRQGRPTLLDPDLFKSKIFRFGVTGQLLQQISLGGTMIALPIFLQMVLEYNAMQAGLSLAPLSLTMFAHRAHRGKAIGKATTEPSHPRRLRTGTAGNGDPCPDRPAGVVGLVPRDPAR